MLKEALTLYEQGRYTEAERVCSELLRHQPKNAMAICLLGVLAVKRQQVERGIALMRQALTLEPRQAMIHYHLGNALQQTGQFEEALVSYDEALALKPDVAQLYHGRGTALAALQQLDQALASLDTALTINPDYAEAHNNRGAVLIDQKRHAEALTNLRRAIALKPDYVTALNNHGVALMALGHLEEALESLARALALEPTFIKAHNNRGLVLAKLKRPREALQAYDNALAIEPQSVEANFGRGTMLLLAGRFEEGWPHYEWRKKRMEGLPFDACGKPEWTGMEDISGKTLLIEAEQGSGDAIQFCRYVPIVADQKPRRVVLTARNSQIRLLQSVDPRLVIAPAAVPPIDFDYYVALASLPRLFNAKEGNIPVRMPYLHADPKDIEHWRKKIGPHGFKIGVTWQGSADSRERSFPLALLTRWIHGADVRIISLQKGAGREQQDQLQTGIEVETLDEDYQSDDFSITAAAMEAMDLIITCDTAAAHLAGALALPVWVALQYAADWRWLLDRPDSPWYPSMRLFRQKSRGDWNSVFAEMASHFNEAIGQKKA